MIRFRLSLVWVTVLMGLATGERPLSSYHAADGAGVVRLGLVEGRGLVRRGVRVVQVDDPRR